MVRVFWLARMWVCAVLGWIGFTYGIPHPLPPHTRTRFISRRLSSLEGTGANSTNEVFVEQLGIIKEPTNLKVLTADIRSKRSEGVNLMTIEDPEWKKQWYLYRDPEPSLNVAGAWQLASGKGVVVGIVSDGVQRHKDLNIDDRLSFDFHKDVPQSVESRGTQAAGVVAATKNHLCGVGVAYNARIADIRLLEEYSNPRVQAEVFKDKLEQVDVQLHTWSQPRAVTGPLAMAGRVQNALHTGATQGRGGKGYIYVWDTGNSNAENSCAYDPFVNNIYTIPISGITKSQHRLRSGTACAAILASAYSQNNNSNDHIVTTIGGSQTSCTDQFGESSAAAAMATGVIALALEVNSNLTWRDIQHLLVYTSNALLLKQRNPHDFIFNGASLMVSNAFGFGLIDAAKLVGMATVWKRVEPAVSCQASATAGVTHIGSGISLHTSIIQVSPMTCRVNYLEHVEVSFNLTYTNGRGSIQLSLESPSGTKNVIVPGRPGDDRQKSFNWTVLSVQYWGENPSGGWKLRLQEAKSSKFSAGTAVLYGWSLKFSGLVNVLQIPEQYPKLSPHLATENTEEVVDTNVISSPMDHPRSDNGVIPWWIWLVVGLACLMVLLGVAYLLRQRFFKHRFRQGDDEKTEEETQSLHQEKQQTTTA